MPDFSQFRGDIQGNAGLSIHQTKSTDGAISEAKGKRSLALGFDPIKYQSCVRATHAIAVNTNKGSIGQRWLQRNIYVEIYHTKTRRHERVGSRGQALFGFHTLFIP